MNPVETPQRFALAPQSGGPSPFPLPASRGEGKRFEWSDRSKHYSASDMAGFTARYL